MKPSRKDILTIPNLLSLLRLMMIPLFVWLYLHGHDGWTAAVLLLSGATDVVDGYIARHYNQVSDFGKAFDPVADKLTQAAMLLCLTTRHPAMLVPLILLVIKETLHHLHSNIILIILCLYEINNSVTLCINMKLLGTVIDINQ